ncbi:MAG: hypothetical protein COU63_04575 [Candidatus Pacebacteria bacterium CG10_big_fil_rev_8_21_14_0_10_36_11]|nr:hypothetical protein [Candidatus Pacearchaeota archaeon]PIR64344.1 MAG: hypothetical protein COU63_04575 [Candidatus Pacebacteria bacterium CG10_big_fil_rev_8_21_14_0_10_36_11]
MPEKLPLYVHAHETGKSLTELMFWVEFQLGKFLLLVLGEEESGLLPMVLISTGSSLVTEFLQMPQTIVAELATQDELPSHLADFVEKIRTSEIK